MVNIYPPTPSEIIERDAWQGIANLLQVESSHQLPHWTKTMLNFYFTASSTDDTNVAARFSYNYFLVISILKNF